MVLTARGRYTRLSSKVGKGNDTAMRASSINLLPFFIFDLTQRESFETLRPGLGITMVWLHPNLQVGTIELTMTQTNTNDVPFNIVESSIEDHRKALNSGQVSSVGLVISYLNRIATYDICSGLNAFTVFNPHVFEEAAASDSRREQGLPPRPLEGIPYTLKDSYKYAGLTVTNGSPALEGLRSNEDSAIAKKLRDAGAVLIGKTNMPPMAAGGMQRGLYGRAESPYNSTYLTAAFSSGSSNGAATSIASSMGVFGMGSETVSSGRSPASNNALVCYTPSRGVLSCRGLWPLYVTCDVPVPYTRSVGDMLDLLSVIATPDQIVKGDFWREQTHVPILKPREIDFLSLRKEKSLTGKRIGVPKLYVGQKDSDSHAKDVYVAKEVVEAWETTAKDLQALGAELVYTDFPLVTNYENDSKSGEANNVDGAPSNWNLVERGILIAKTWNEFLVQNEDAKMKSLSDIKDSSMLFPKPKDYIPDTFLEVRNWIDYAGLPALISQTDSNQSIYDLPGLAAAVRALEAQRKRDLEDWMEAHSLDVIVFPAQGDVGLADLESNLDSTKHSLQNGVKYSNGNRAIRHLGVPTVSVPMGVLGEKKMPLNLTFSGKAYDDDKLLEYAYAFEQATKHRTTPPLTPRLNTDTVVSSALGSRNDDSKLDLQASVQTTKNDDGSLLLRISGTVSMNVKEASIQVFVDGKDSYQEIVSRGKWEAEISVSPKRPVCLGWNLKPLKSKDLMVIVVARAEGKLDAKLLWA